MKYYKYSEQKKIKLPLILLLAFLLSLSFIFKASLQRAIVTVNMGTLYVKYLNGKAEFLNFIHANPIKEVHIKMSPNNFVKIQKERTKMLSNYILTGNQWLSKNQYFKVKYTEDNSGSSGEIRLFGMNPDHYRDYNGHSFRIKFNGSTGFGKKKVNFINPRSRDFITDVFSNTLFNALEGGIELKYTPVKVIFNKSDYGYYVKEDFFDKYLLEENERRESVIFEIHQDSLYFNHIGEGNSFLPLANQLSELFKNDYKTFLTLFDTEKIKSILMISLIINDTHPLFGINLHWCFNPVTGLIEPTIREGSAYLIKNVDFDNLKFIDGIFTDLFKNYIEDSFIEYLVKNLPKVTDLINNNPDYNAYKKKMSGFQNEIEQKEFIIKSNIKYISEKLKDYIPNDIAQDDTIIIENDTIINNNWTIEKDQILVIREGVNMELNGIYLKIYGGLRILGTPQKPIIIEGSPNNPSTIFVNSEKPIIIKNSYFNYFTNLKSSFNQPSAITFYKTDNITIDGCTFSNNLSGDDYLNFFRSKNVTITNSTLQNCLSDAIDSDFSNLKIHTVQFENIGNDAIDGSGSNIEVINSSFYRVQDKAISAGENSWFYVTSSKFLNNEIALVAKDGSLLISKENTLLNNRLDLVAFKKKKIFGPPSVEIINTTIKPVLIEKKSNVKGLSEIIYSSNVESKLYGNLYGKSSK